MPSIDDIYVEIKLMRDQVKSELAKFQSDVERKSKEIEGKLNFKARFDGSMAKLRITELQNYRNKLQAVFDKKVAMNVDIASLDRTRKQLASIDSQLAGVGKTAQTAGSKLSGTFSSIKNIFSSLGLVAGLGGMVAVIKQSVKAGQELVVSQQKLNQVFKSTGGTVGFNVAEIHKYSKELADLSGISAPEVNAALARLMGYTGLTGEMFKKAGVAAADMATFLNIDLGQAAERVGNALQYPSEAINSLTRQGFRFTDEQKNMIAEFERTNQKAKAQQIILDELNLAYGGQAQSIRDAKGAMGKLELTVGNLSETLGFSLLPALNDVAGALDNTAKEGDKLSDVFKTVGTAAFVVSLIVQNGINVLKILWSTVGNLAKLAAQGITGDFAGAWETVKKGTKDLTSGVSDYGSAWGTTFTGIGKMWEDTVEKMNNTSSTFNFKTGKIEPLKPLSFDITSNLDTTAGDEILKQYREQQDAIEQIKNKLKDTTLIAAERIVLQKELNALREKPTQKTDADKKYIEDLANSLEEYRKKIKLVTDELNKIGEGDSEKKIILTAELSKLQEQLKEAEITLGLKVDFDAEDIDTQSLMDALALETDAEIANKLEEQLNTRLKAHKDYFDGLSILNKEAYDEKVKQADLELQANLDAFVDEEEAYAIHKQRLAEIDEEYLEEKEKIIKSEIEQIALLGDAIGGFAALAKQIGGEQSAAYKIFAVAQATMATYAAAAQALLVQPPWVGIALAAGVTAAGLANVAQIMAAHEGGEFLGTSKGIKKLAKGGSFRVPEGYPNDSYPLMVESGEHVSVTPAHKVRKQEIPKFATGTEFNVPSKYINDSFLMRVSGDERVKVTPSNKVGDTEDLLSDIANKIALMNANLVDKNFAPNINADTYLDGRRLTKAVFKTINKMQQEGRKTL